MKKVLILFCVIGTSAFGAQQEKMSFPGEEWQRYVVPEDAGFSAEKLDSVHALFKRSGAAGLFVVHRGRVLASWGETSRRFICASVRKSFMNAMIGIAVQRGDIDLEQSLAELKIDDLQQLTAQERQAKVRHLLAATSGIYHPAAYSPESMIKNLPERGSAAPGENWYYNNWDFNTLVTIFNQQTRADFFERFYEWIATPVHMQDFDLSATYYRFEPEKSQHPAYLFRMSARDMARFGLLYLNGGRWKSEQIVPRDWVKASTRIVSQTTERYRDLGDYGYLWWRSAGVAGENMYFASGSGGQKISVLPEADLVIVHVVNTYENRNVNHRQFIGLLEKLLAARTTTPNPAPRLQALAQAQRETPRGISLEASTLERYVGNYQHRALGSFTISRDGNQLFVESGIGKLSLIALSENQFWTPDIETPLFFEKADEAQKHTVRPVMNENNQMQKVIFYY